MKYRNLGTGGPKVSAVGLGTWAMAGNSYGKVDDAESIRAIHRALEEGINLVDTAASYGGGYSEKVVGMGLKGRRQQAFLCTKCGIHPNKERTALEYDLKPESIRGELENSLKNLQTDYIDLYQFHYPDPSTPISESLGELKRLREEGKIRYIGLSNFSLEQIREAVSVLKPDSVQVQFSLLEQSGREILRYCGEQGIGVLTYGSIAGGMLSGKFQKPPVFQPQDTRERFYPYFKEPVFSRCRRLVDVLEEIAGFHGWPVSAAAIAWVNQQEGVTCALVGAKTPLQASANAGAGDCELKEEELKKIERAWFRLQDESAGTVTEENET